MFVSKCAKNDNNLIEIFANPPARFRGAPFWAWNTKLNNDDLLWQIEQLKEMGFGGFFMHTRSGMETPYLGKEFMGSVRACVEKAKQDGMFAYLYDEDRWSSGSAGGYVTKHKEFRQRSICLSLHAPEEMKKQCEKGGREPELITVFDIVFDKRDRLQSYKQISQSKSAKGEKWYVYVLLGECLGWYNGYTYLDTMNPDAVDTFIDVTYNAYKREEGNEFGKTVPAIFTDEPNYGTAGRKTHARDGMDVSFPWTNALRARFSERYGTDILEKLPELVWNTQDDAPSSVRYRYYALISEMFAESYCDKIGKWCKENNIAFTGHVLNERTLQSQTSSVGEAMRQYREFTVPGIDMLCNYVELTTAKQAQSVVHQCGRKAMMSELYGVTGWDFDFRGHKFQGDWQAALGVTFRVPHLAWVSMQGSAKRDYPASISYQSAWYKKYGYIEDHYARLNTALTRGTPCVSVAVIHPVESAWTVYGCVEQTSAAMENLDGDFCKLTDWLLRGQIDFDFISESMLPDLYRGIDDGFTVGEMSYQAVLIPPVLTLRCTTLAYLTEFIRRGGKVITSGVCPEYVDGLPSNAAKELWATAQSVAFSETDILQVLEPQREVFLQNGWGGPKKDMIYTLRRDGNGKWLFIAHCDAPSRFDGNDCACDNMKIVVKGIYTPTLYNTIDGMTESVIYEHRQGSTVINVTCHSLDSFLFSLVPAEERTGVVDPPALAAYNEIPVVFDDFVEYETSEPNVAVLDMAEWSRDGKTYAQREEILRIDKKIRDELGYPLADGIDIQPWCIEKKDPTEFVYLRFSIESETATDCILGYERLENVWQNGIELQPSNNGYYVDKAIHTMPLLPLRKGKNELIVRVPISERISVENFFLLGDFGVEVCGSHMRITERRKKLTFGSFVRQSFPFYGGEITYKIPFECESGDLHVTADWYEGALIGVRLDGKDAGNIVLPPYELIAPDVKGGKHVLELTLYATRINTFGALHLCIPVTWKGPGMWYSQGNGWSYEYYLRDAGIMKKPVLTVRTAKK